MSFVRGFRPLPALLVACSLSVGAEVPGTLDLTPGTARVIELEVDAGAAFVADPAIADVNVLDRKRLFVLGKAPGITSLEVRAGDGQSIAAYAVRVSTQTGHASTVVQRLAGDSSDIRVDSVGAALFVSGTAASPSQAEQVLRGIRAVSDAPVVDALTLDSLAQVNLEVLISEVSRTVTNELGIDWSVELNPLLYPWATVGGVRLGTGALELGEFREHLVQLLNPLGQVVVENDTQWPGVRLPQTRFADGGVVATHGWEVNSGKYHLTAFIDALAENGLVAVHARPNLTTLSGQPAEFFSGLEVPVPTITDRGVVGTVYHQTGVNLTFTPTVLAKEQISLSVEARVRELAVGGATIAGTAVPNINERSASTTVELGDNESIAIAGLYRRTTGASEAGVPLLKDVPLWGKLFKTTQEKDEAAELIIVVTPRIVAAAPRAALAAQAAPGDAARQLGDRLYY